jgi:hypothetical protein
MKTGDSMKHSQGFSFTDSGSIETSYATEHWSVVPS